MATSPSKKSTPNPNPIGDWSNYDEKLYYMQSTDDKGHFKNTQIATPPDVYAMAMALVASDDHAYRTFQDVVRDALIHLLELRNRIVPDPTVHWQMIKYRNEERRRQRMEAGRMDYLILKNIEESIKQAKLSGDPNAFEKEITEAEEVAGTLPPNLMLQVRNIVLDARTELAILKKQIERYSTAHTANGNGSHN